MKATVLQAYGDVGQFLYTDVPDPVPGAGQLLIKLEASGLNPVDLFVRQGYLAQNVPLVMPAILGLDGGGTVAALGAGVSGFAVGDRVAVKLPIGDHGTHAEYTLARPENLAKIGPGISFPVAATLGLAGITAWRAVDALAPRAGDRVLVTGALGGVGRAALVYLKHKGAIPVAAVRAERVGEAQALGEAVDAMGGRPGSFDGAIHATGPEVGSHAVTLVRDGGTLVSVAQLPEDVNADHRITIARLWAQDSGDILQQVADAASSGALTIPIGATFKLSQLAEAHTRLAAGRTQGKLILVP